MTWFVVIIRAVEFGEEIPWVPFLAADGTYPGDQLCVPAQDTVGYSQKKKQ